MFKTKPEEIFNCERCGAELSPNASRCIICRTKARTHKQGKHWAAMGLVGLCLSIYSISGALYHDYIAGGYQIQNPVNIFNYMSLLIALAALVIAIVRIPKSRPVLKFFSIALSAIMLFINIDWIRFVLSQ